MGADESGRGKVTFGEIVSRIVMALPLFGVGAILCLIGASWALIVLDRASSPPSPLGECDWVPSLLGTAGFATIGVAFLAAAGLVLTPLMVAPELWEKIRARRIRIVVLILVLGIGATIIGWNLPGECPVMN